MLFHGIIYFLVHNVVICITSAISDLSNFSYMFFSTKSFWIFNKACWVKIFIVIYLGGGVFRVCEFISIKHGRWSDSFFISIPEQCSCVHGRNLQNMSSIKVPFLFANRVDNVICGHILCVINRSKKSQYIIYSTPVPTGCTTFRLVAPPIVGRGRHDWSCDRSQDAAIGSCDQSQYATIYYTIALTMPRLIVQSVADATIDDTIGRPTQ